MMFQTVAEPLHNSARLGYDCRRKLFASGSFLPEMSRDVKQQANVVRHALARLLFDYVLKCGDAKDPAKAAPRYRIIPDPLVILKSTLSLSKMMSETCLLALNSNNGHSLVMFHLS